MRRITAMFPGVVEKGPDALGNRRTNVPDSYKLLECGPLQVFQAAEGLSKRFGCALPHMADAESKDKTPQIPLFAGFNGRKQVRSQLASFPPSVRIS